MRKAFTMTVLDTFSLTDRTAIVTGASEADAHRAQSGAPPQSLRPRVTPTSGPMSSGGTRSLRAAQSPASAYLAVQSKRDGGHGSRGDGQ
jgi:hypothetical protein